MMARAFFEVLDPMFRSAAVDDRIELAVGEERWAWDAKQLRAAGRALQALAVDIERKERQALETERRAVGAVILNRPDRRIERDGAFVERHDNGHGFWCLSGRRGDDKFIWPHTAGRFHVMSRKPTDEDMDKLLAVIVGESAAWPEAPTDCDLHPMEVV